jgi:hypothetical protein
MGECEACGQQIVWTDGDFITLDGQTSCPNGGEHRLAKPQDPNALNNRWLPR